MSENEIGARGASTTAVRRHYDLGNDFYALWLDPTSMSYTCGLYEEGDDLDRAQLRKIDYLVAAAGAAGQGRVLDIGSGWGNTLRRLVEVHGVGRAVGLTLSEEQARWMARRPDPRVEVRVESWVDHEPEAPYDAIVSIEAIEAFARPGLSSAEKIDVYRALFERCHRWLRPGGGMALQTTAYGNSGAEDLDEFITAEIFPEHDLPRLAEIASASERLFEIVTVRNDRQHYIRTTRSWLDRLRENRAEAERIVGKERVDHYLRYLRLCVYMFVSGGCDLLRVEMRRIDSPRARRAARAEPARTQP